VVVVRLMRSAAITYPVVTFLKLQAACHTQPRLHSLAAVTQSGASNKPATVIVCTRPNLMSVVVVSLMSSTAASALR
jgi:ABC-type tungstate transport system substrate-binding protein